MATDPQIDGFNPDEVRAGLRLAMTVGLPTSQGDQPIFFMPATVTGDGTHALDQQGVPFTPGYRPTRVVPTGVRVPCAVEYHDTEGRPEAFGVMAPARVVLTLLDQDYAQVEGFAYCVIGGIRYVYHHTETPKALVSVGLYKVHCTSDDEG